MNTFGDSTGVGIAKETTRGTAVDPSSFIETREPVNFQTDVNTTEIKETKGTGMATQGESVVGTKVAGDISAYLRYHSVGHFLRSLLGGYSVAAEAGKFRHTFTLNPAVLQPTLSIALARGNLDHKIVNGAVCSKFALEIKLDDAIAYVASMLGRTETDHADFAPAYGTDPVVLRQFAKVKIADNIAGLAEAVGIQEAKIEIDRGSSEQRSLGSVAASDFKPGLCSISGEFVIEKQDDTFRTKTNTGAVGAVQYNIASTEGELTITLPKVTFKEEEDVPADDVIRGKVKFTAHYDDTTSQGITISLLNDVATYA